MTVGKKNPIELEFREPKGEDDREYSMAGLIGDQGALLGKGSFGEVYKMKSKSNFLALKFIPIEKFSGDEVRVTEEAYDLGIGARYLGSWVTKDKNNKLFTVIEMVVLEGKTVKDMMIDCDERYEDEDEKISAVFDFYEKRGKTYLFDKIFDMLFTLVENNISYKDIHFGNLFAQSPPDRLELKLIDFGSAKIHNTKEKAAARIIASERFTTLVDLFENLEDEYRGEIAKGCLTKLKKLASSVKKN